MSIERDTQFIGFARLLWEDVGEAAMDLAFGTDEFSESIYTRIAQRTHDLMKHACTAIINAQMARGAYLQTDTMLRAIPDLTSWTGEDTGKDDLLKRGVVWRLFRLWEEHPDLRLGQLLVNAFGDGLYFKPDLELIGELEAFYRQREEGERE